MNRKAFVSTNKSSWGGSEYLWYQTFIRLLNKGDDVIASVPRWKHMPSEIGSIRNKAGRFFFNTENSALKKMYNRFVPSGIQLDYKNDGYKFLLEFKPDLTIISQGGNSGGIDLMEFCIDNNLKYVTIVQAANEAKWPTDDLNERLSRGYSKSEMNYFVSHANIRLTEIQIGQSISNSKVIFNPFNIQYENDLKYPAVHEYFLLANVSRHEFYAKGQDLLFQVLSEKKWKERNLKVNLYGKGEHSQSLKKLKDFFKLDNVTVAGHIDPYEIWKVNHALILTSRYEGLPLALVEAMLCERMGIVTNVSGNPEIVKDNVNGFLAKAPTVEFIDEALERAWQRRNEWESIGAIAGSDARSIIPKDPIGHFINELEAIKV